MPLIIKSDIVSFLSQLTSFLDPAHKEPERQIGRRDARVGNGVLWVRRAPGSHETEADAALKTRRPHTCPPRLVSVNSWPPHCRGNYRSSPCSVRRGSDR